MISEQNSNAGHTINLCEWIILCEVAQGLIDARVLQPQQILINLARRAPNRLTHFWAAYVLRHSVHIRTLRNFLAEPLSLIEANKLINPSMLLSELLLGPRYTHTSCFQAISQIMNPNLGLSSVNKIWQAMDTYDYEKIQATLDEYLVPLVNRDWIVACFVAQFILRRVHCWPLFSIPQTQRDGGGSAEEAGRIIHRHPYGLSLPLSISVTHAQGDHRKTEMLFDNEKFSFPNHRYGINTQKAFRSLLHSVQAAQDVWRSQHGRVVTSYRDVILDCSFTFDFRPTIRTLQILGYYDCSTEVPGFEELKALRTQFSNAIKSPQRSLEAYMGQAIIAKVLERRFGARTAATGCLYSPAEQERRQQQLTAQKTTKAVDIRKPPRRRFNWQLGWPQNAHPKQLVQSIMSKALHAGNSGAYERLVVPYHPATVAQLQGQRVQIGKQSYIPNLVPVTNLARLLDVSLTGLWRNQRFVRSEHLAMLSSVVSSSTQRTTPLNLTEDYLLKQYKETLAPVVRELANLLRQSKRSCMFIRTDNPELLVRALVGWLAQLNSTHLDGHQAPRQLAQLVFRAMDHEVGLPFLATLYQAMAGQLDGVALKAVQDYGTTNAAAPQFASWFDHRYLEHDAWQGPDLTIVYGIANIRQHSKRRIFGGETWLDPLSLLVDLDSHLGEVADIRHKEHIGETRFIIVDKFDDSDSITSILDKRWNIVDVRTHQSEIPAPSWVGPSTTAKALSLLRTGAPLPTVLSARRALDSIAKDDFTILSEIFAEARQGHIISFNGLYTLLPESASYYMQNLSSMEQLQMHIVITRSYAPWLNTLSYPGCPAVSSVAVDEWLHPERLSEIWYHLDVVRRLAYENNHLIRKSVLGTLTRALQLQHHTAPARLRILRRYKQNQAAYKEWKRICKYDVPANQAERYQVLSIGAFLLFEVFEDRVISLSKEDLETQVNRLLDDLRTISKPMKALSRLWMQTVELLIEAQLCCSTENDLTPEFVSQLKHNIKLCCDKGMTLNDGATVFEALGDMSLFHEKLDDARQWYYLCVVACSRHTAFCRVKLHALEDSMQLLSEQDLKRAIRRFQRKSSPIARLRSVITAKLAMLLPGFRSRQGAEDEPDKSSRGDDIQFSQSSDYIKSEGSALPDGS